MLNNTVSIDNGDGTFRKMPYYDWIMKNNTPTKYQLKGARKAVSGFTSKSGHCFFRFVDNNSGYIVRYKVTFTLNSTENAESTKNGYTVASVIYATGGTNSNNTRLDEVTFAKKETYMQKASTVYEILSDGTYEYTSSDTQIFRTAITPIFVLTVKVPKPMYTYGSWSVSGFEMNGVPQELAKSSRFNFKEYNWQNTGDSTFDNKVYHQETIDTLTACVNILSCGFTVKNDEPIDFIDNPPEHDTINVVYKHPVLNVNFYKNGGTVESTEYNPDAENPVTRKVVFNKYYNETYGLPEVAALGFKKEGYSPESGKEWQLYDGSRTWDESKTDYRARNIKDFDDGTYFTTSERDLYVNWDANVYKVTLDNQGADTSGTKSTWYKYNTYKKVTLKDGTEQYNYFYTASDLKTALNSGYKIVIPTKDGYIFKGYYTKKNGQGTRYIKPNGSFVNQLWKQIGPHTLYAYWEAKPPEIGNLIIKRNMTKSFFHKSHGNSTFLFKIVSASDTSKVYYRRITFNEAAVAEGTGTVAVLKTECELPYGKYTIDAIPVFRYQNNLYSMTSGSMVNTTKGSFQLSENCREVTVVYNGKKQNWARFSHNDLKINDLS